MPALSLQAASKDLMRRIVALLVFCIFASNGYASAQSAPEAGQSAPIFRTRTNLVLVPALVRTKSGEPVFSLTAHDFLLTDDDHPQKLSLEQDTDGEPLAVVIAVETGGAGARHLDDYRNLGTTIEALVGG